VVGIPDKKRCIITREVSRTVGSDLDFVLLGLRIPSSVLSSSRESQEESDEGVGGCEAFSGCMESVMNGPCSEVRCRIEVMS